MSRTIFVTGIAGFLGSHIAETLIARGDRVIGNDNLCGGYPDNVPEGATFLELDCSDLDAMTEAMRGVDVVYHCAALAHEGLSVFSPTIVTQETVQASVSVFTAAIRNQVQRIVFCSSMARYGASPTPFLEDMPPAPADPYGIAKVAAEQLLRNLAEVHGVEWSIAVPHNIIGRRQKYDDPFRNVCSIMVNLMLQDRQPIIYGDGEQQRCFSPVEDCVDTLLAMGESPKAVGEIINIGPDDRFMTINELATLIAGKLDFDLDPIYVPDRPQEVRLALCSSAKARRVLGYEQLTDVDAAVDDIIDYIGERGPRPFEYHLQVEIQNELTPKTWSERRF
jgi:UDP-glucose 4-epimerase